MITRSQNVATTVFMGGRHEAGHDDLCNSEVARVGSTWVPFPRIALAARCSPGMTPNLLRPPVMMPHSLGARITMHFEDIETSRLRLRAIAASDWPAVFATMSDPRVTAFLPEGTLDEAAARAFAQEHAGDDGKAVAVVEKATGRVIG